MKKCASLLLLGLLGATVWAQSSVDPSSASLLRSSGRPPAKESLDSSRYTVKPAPPKKEKEKPLVEKTATPAPAAEEKDSNPVQQTQAIDSLVPVAEPAPSEAPANQGVGGQMQEMILGGTTEDIDDYKRRLHPADSRNNFAEILVAPMLLNVDSRSNYWFRDYVSTSPGLHIGANFWLTPFFGLQANYITSLSSDIRGDPNGTRNVQADHQWFSAGLRFRKFFGLSRKAPSLSFGLDMDEYRLKVPSEETNRIGLKSTAVRLAVDAQIPSASSSSYSWLLGAEILPRITQKEVETAVDVRSGTKHTTNAIGFNLGGQYSFNRNSQIFFKAGHRMEKTLFEGVANTNDPKTGAAPEGVSVYNNLTFFELGYRWGD